MLGSPGEPIIIAGRICYPANFSASATVRRTFAHTLVQNQEAGRTPKAKAKISSEGKKSTLSVSQLGHVIMLDHSSPTERFFPGRGVSPTPKQTTDNASSR